MLNKLNRSMWIGIEIKFIRELLSIPYNIVDDTGALWESIIRLTVIGLITILLGAAIVILIKDIKGVWQAYNI